MKRLVVILGLLALLLPMAAWADTIAITNQGGTVTFGASGITSKGSELTGWGNIVAAPGQSLGSVSFTTGGFSSGSLWTGGTLSSTGSSFDVMGMGPWAKKLAGQSTNPVALFTGSFTGPIAWTLDSQNHANYVFTLSGTIEGTLYTGRVVTGTTSQTIYAYTDQEPYDHKGTIHMGSSSVTVPEPGTLGLLGTGLVGIAGMMRRRLFGA